MSEFRVSSQDTVFSLPKPHDTQQRIIFIDEEMIKFYDIKFQA